MHSVFYSLHLTCACSASWLMKQTGYWNQILRKKWSKLSRFYQRYDQSVSLWLITCYWDCGYRGHGISCHYYVNNHSLLKNYGDKNQLLLKQHWKRTRKISFCFLTFGFSWKKSLSITHHYQTIFFFTQDWSLFIE